MTDEQILACNNAAAEDQEFTPRVTAPDEDLIAFGRQVLLAAGAGRDELVKLLEEVRQCFTRDDDLPGGLLLRIDAAIDGVPASAAIDGIPPGWADFMRQIKASPSLAAMCEVMQKKLDELRAADGVSACPDCQRQRESALVQGGPILCPRHGGVPAVAPTASRWAERDAFEKWASEQPGDELDLHGGQWGVSWLYTSPATQHAWTGWLARSRAAGVALPDGGQRGA